MNLNKKIINKSIYLIFRLIKILLKLIHIKNKKIYSIIMDKIHFKNIIK